jgi:cytochrome c oxidase subunit 4
MSAPAALASAPAAGHHEPSKYHFYIQVAMILSVVTGIEVVLVYLPLAKWFVVSTLLILSAGKFMAVIFYFMHLRWDKVFCTILFFIGLVLAGGTMWALLHLFGADASKPLSAAALEMARLAVA